MAVAFLAVAPHSAFGIQGQQGESVPELRILVTTITRRLPSQSPEEQAVDRETLVGIERELNERLPQLQGSHLTQAHLALSRSLTARASTNLAVDALERAGWCELAGEHAVLAERYNAAARASLMRGRLLLETGSKFAAQRVLEEAIEQFPEAAPTHPYMWHTLAEIQRRTGEIQAALSSLERAESGLDPSRDGPLEWRILGVRGQIYIDMGLFDIAAQVLAKERELVNAAEVPLTTDRVASHQRWANLLLSRGQYEEARRWVVEALDEKDLYFPNTRYRAQLEILRGLALAHLERLEPDREELAVDVLLDALATEQVPKPDRVRALVPLARLELHRGRAKKAQAFLAAARAEMGTAQRAFEEPQLWFAALATVEAELAMFQGQSEERLRECLTQLEDAVLERIDLFQRTPLRGGGVGVLNFDIRRAWFSAATRLALELDGPNAGAHRALELSLRLERSSTFVRGLAGPDVLVEDVRESLAREGGGIACFVPGPTRSHLLLLDGKGAIGYELADEGVLAAARDPYLAALRSLQRAAGPEALAAERAAAQTLSDLLIPVAAAERLMDWKQLSLLGFDYLGSLPVQYLPLGEHEFAGLGWNLSYLPSMTFSVLARNRARPQATTDICLVAAPTLGSATISRWPELEELAFDDRHARNLVSPYSQSRVLTHADATVKALGESNLTSTAVLQVLAHCVRDYRRERPAALALAPSTSTGEDLGLFGSDEVELLDAPSLVLLTSCGAGVGPRRLGDGASGHLGGAWLARGASAVLLSKDDLPYAITLDLSARIHSHLAHGAGPAEALRLSLISLMEDRDFAHPVQCGSLYVLGIGADAPFQGRAEPLITERHEETGGAGSRGIPATVWGALAGLGVGVVAWKLSRRPRAS